MAVYDILKEPWIPVEDMAGGQRTVSIRELFTNAHSLKKVADPSPLIAYGIQRMLIAILMDAYRPKHVDILTDIIAAGRYDEHLIARYFMLCQQDVACFDLFHTKKPFYQSAFDSRWVDDKKIKPVALLLHEVPTGNNHIHFDHRLQSSLALSPALCARALCALNVFCTAGLQGPSSIYGAPPLYVLHKGRTLF